MNLALENGKEKYGQGRRVFLLFFFVGSVQDSEQPSLAGTAANQDAKVAPGHIKGSSENLVGNLSLS